MSKIYVVFWSGTGNTEVMATSVGEGIKNKGKECEVVDVTSISTSALDDSTVFALGCPSMGAEELEEDTMEPFVAELESKVSGKKVVLFGSYDWGDGEWMENWVSRMQSAGATVVDHVIVNNTPDSEGLALCVTAGEKLASI